MSHTGTVIKNRWELVVKDAARNDVKRQLFEGSAGEAIQLITDAAREFNPTFELAMWRRDPDGDAIHRMRGTARMTWDGLTRQQQKLAALVEDKAGPGLHDVLKTTDSTAKDRAAVADYFGGPGAGAEFRRQHISMRGECRICYKPGAYYDGIRDPYWVHTEVFGSRASSHAFEPNDAHTRRAFDTSTR
ncbi:hypothetical protein [Actinoplanes sp. N902-109]|uniref:hypothetical protein n=1 Tax=Actinoplanes sp. (strain N902-109) TaxID=649831 RepID=UPI00032937CA|nr:hypothetical protein [Actinoplanes sp. N902-109]AGL13899.1 hypothetical protein L083_0389 [Actinoplanes sp. N902-109]